MTVVATASMRPDTADAAEFTGSPANAAGVDTNRATAIELHSVTQRFGTPSGSAFTALRDVNLRIEPGQFCAIVGPTGCGKSTTLGLVSGLDQPSAGTVRVGEREVDGIAAGPGFMFQ